MKIFLCFALSALACITSAVSAETNPTDNSPVSLAVTSKFIQDKLNEVGAVNFEALIHNSNNDTDWNKKYSSLVNKVIVSSTSCSINGEFHLEIDDKVIYGKKDKLLLKDVTKVVVMPTFQFITNNIEAGGRPEISALGINPENIYSVVLAMTGRNLNSPVFLFRDQETANQVADAMNNAIKICSNKPLVSKNRSSKARN